MGGSILRVWRQYSQMPAHPTLRHSEEPQDFVQYTGTLVRLEKELSVRGTIQNDQFFRPGVFSYCARMPGSRSPASLASSRATMYKALDFSFSAGRFGAPPSNTMGSISPGADLTDASPAAPPPKLPRTADTVFMRLQVANRSDYVIFKGCVIEISLAGTRRAAKSM